MVEWLAWGGLAAVALVIGLVAKRCGIPKLDETRADVLLEHLRGGHGARGG